VLSYLATNASRRVHNLGCRRSYGWPFACVGQRVPFRTYIFAKAQVKRDLGNFGLTAMVGAAIGWIKRRFWGWALAVIIIASQVLGDLVNALRGEFWKGAVEVVIAGALLVYLLRPRVRAIFSDKDERTRQQGKSALSLA
jgi:uncharacterized membrane protein